MFEAFHLIAGAPLTDDADPSVTPPAAARQFQTEAGQHYALVELVDGTSCTATAWSSDGATWAESRRGEGNEADLVAGTPARIAVDPGTITTIRLTAIAGSPTLAVCVPDRDAPNLLSRIAGAAKGGGLLTTAIAAVEGLLGILNDGGLFTVAHDAEVVATSDGNGNPLTIQAKTGGISGSVVQTVTFTYDGNGNEASRARS
jgi:hypothetical protein